MRPISEYDTYIFDCDGVILDSNQLKIDAMRNTLLAHNYEEKLVSQCVDYFSVNFGKSRFHHVDVFVNDILPLSDENKETAKGEILAHYASQCRALYLDAPITSGFVDFISHLNGNKYVASGSEQQELRDVFQSRGLDRYFNHIYGSPTPKASIVKSILAEQESQKAVMFGDAKSDLIAAQENDIDFVFYEPLSNVRAQMLELCRINNLPVINNFSEVIIK